VAKKIVAPKISVDEALVRLREMHERGDVDAMFAAMLELLTRLVFDNATLSADNARLLKRALGQTSERVGGAQLDMLLKLVDAPKDEQLAAPSVDDEQEGEKRGKGKQKKRDNHGRGALPAHLPRVENVVRVEGEARNCPICGKERTCIGHATSETLEYSPASFSVIVNKCEKLACREHEEGGVVTAPAATKGIDKGIPGPGLLAHVVVLKYADHVGLHHIRTMLLREDIDIPVSTLVGWVRAADNVLVPIADRIHALAFVSHVLHADDTGLKVLDEDSPGGAYRGRMWGMVGDRTWASYCFKPSADGAHAVNLLAAREGYLVVDAHGNYDALFKLDNATEVGCWCHARRPFVEALDQGDTRCAVIVKLVKGLYEIEREASALGLDNDERRKLRLRKSAPILDDIRAWAQKQLSLEPPGGEYRRACNYLIKHQAALHRFLEDGALPLDNNEAERSVRGVAQGRKSWLFAGSDAGAERAATLYTILTTCRLNGVNPWQYLRDVFSKLNSGWLASRLDELLPVAPDATLAALAKERSIPPIPRPASDAFAEREALRREKARAPRPSSDAA
jgi:transposase